MRACQDHSAGSSMPSSRPICAAPGLPRRNERPQTRIRPVRTWSCPNETIAVVSPDATATHRGTSDSDPIWAATTATNAAVAPNTNSTLRPRWMCSFGLLTASNQIRCCRQRIPDRASSFVDHRQPRSSVRLLADEHPTRRYGRARGACRVVGWVVSVPNMPGHHPTAPSELPPTIPTRAVVTSLSLLPMLWSSLA